MATRLTERKDSQQQELLTECRQAKLDIVERAQDEQRKRYLVRVEGEFARAGVPTDNGRVYGKHLWEREIDRLSPLFEQRSVFGELDHPDEGRTKLKRVSHLITDLRLENGIVVGTAEILPTSQGRDLAALLEANCRVGVSSRGRGSVVKNGRGESVVQEDFRLSTFDFVADPADKTAYPEVFTEDDDDDSLLFEGVMLDELESLLEQEDDDEEEEDADDSDDERSDDENKSSQTESRIADYLNQIDVADPPNAVRPLVEGLRKQLAPKMRRDITEAVREKAYKQARQDVLDEMAEWRDEVEKDLRESYDRDELEKVDRIKQLQEADQRQKRLIEDLSDKLEEVHETNEKLSETARLLGYRYYLEKRLAGADYADELKEKLGDVARFRSPAAFREEVDALEEDIQQRLEEQARIEEEKRAIQRRANKERRRLRTEVTRLEEATHKALEINKRLALQVYTERKLARHPRRDRARVLIEKANPTTEAEVDELLESARPRELSRHELREQAARVTKITRGGISALRGDEETPWRREGEDLLAEDREEPPRRSARGYNGLGVSLGDIKRYLPSAD